MTHLDVAEHYRNEINSTSQTGKWNVSTKKMHYGGGGYDENKDGGDVGGWGVMMVAAVVWWRCRWRWQRDEDDEGGDGADGRGGDVVERVDLVAWWCSNGVEWQRLRWLCMVLKWVGGDEGGGMMMVAVDLWWGRGLGWRGWPDGVAGKVGRKKVAAPEVSPEIERRGDSSVCED
ncbi:hypothetical protein Tco_0887264 [Tanacetum coccineum]